MHIMQTYSVENDLDVDFFAALKKMQQSSHEPMQMQGGQEQLQGQQEQDSCNDDHVCLITNEPLNAFHVELACGHAFNYDPFIKKFYDKKEELECIIILKRSACIRSSVRIVAA
jgi:hypothetical protein